MRLVALILCMSSVIALSGTCVSANSILNNVVPAAVGDAGTSISDASVGAFEAAKIFLREHASHFVMAGVPAGLIVCFYGYFVLYPIIFLLGFCVGAFVSYFAVTSLVSSVEPTSFNWIPVLFAFIGGICLGLVAIYLIQFGIFLIGAALGVVTSLAIDSIVLVMRPDRPAYMLYLSMAALGVIFGLVALRKQNELLVVFTAFFGAFVFLYGIGFFLGHFPAWESMDNAALLRDPVALLYVILYIACGVLGSLVQMRVLRRKSAASAGYVYLDSQHGVRLLMDDDYDD